MNIVTRAFPNMPPPHFPLGALDISLRMLSYFCLPVACPWLSPSTYRPPLGSLTSPH